MDNFSLSENGLSVLKQSEGSRLKAYQDDAGIWTIGYGHTGKVNGVPIHQGMTITSQQQDELLKHDLQRFENAVRNHVKVPINQDQFDSLVNFAFNVGDGAFIDSTLVRYLNLGDYDEAGNQFLRWNKTNGKFNQGLFNRRQRERELFLGKDVPIPADYAPANEPYDLPPPTDNLQAQQLKPNYDNQLAAAFGVQPKVEQRLPDYISNLARSIYDSVA